MTKKQPKINTSDWRNIPHDKWNVRTFKQMFVDLNRQYYGMDYAPLRNWSFEQGVIKRALIEHGPEILRQAFDECFRTYKPTRQYPILTAGFAVSYLINAIIPRLQAEQAEKDRRAAEKVVVESSVNYGAISW